MSRVESVAPADRAITQRARLRTMLERRKRFWRRIVVFVVVTSVMVLVALANRDTLHRRGVLEQATMVADALQETYERENYLSLRFPDLPEPYAQLGRRYHFNIFYASQSETHRRVGVCCLEEPLQFFLRAEGRVVVLFNGKQFISQWMLEREFRAEADKLGFGSLLEK